MNKKEQVVVICLVLVVILTICGVSLWLSRRDNRQAALEPTSSLAVQPSLAVADNAMGQLELFGTETAVARQTEEALFDDEGGVMGEIAMFGTQTAIAANHTPMPTLTFLKLLSTQKYWSPPVNDSFSPHFVYDTNLWALTDLRTLANLQESGCTLRVGGGRGLGPGWTTEASFLQVNDRTFTTILAKYETTPEFMTYSLIESSVVFEIAAPAEFEQCRRDGEVVLKTMLIP